MSSCGPCTMCCTILHVDELNKPADHRCSHCDKKGCSIYQDRPSSCREFECLWLKSQSVKGKEMPPKFRPDRCGVVMQSAKTSLGRDQLTLFTHQYISDPKLLSKFMQKFTDGIVHRTNTPILLMTGNRAYGKFAVGQWKELRNTLKGWISKQDSEDDGREEARIVD